MPSGQPRAASPAINPTAARTAAALAILDALPERRGAAWAVFALAVLAAGGYSISLGADANWDLHNYHLYNAYALLNGRYLWDVAPAGMQTFFHPLADVPFYLLVTALPESPRAIAFVMAVPHAVSALLVFLIARRLLPPTRTGRAFAIAAAVAIGVTGAALLTTVGGTMNDYQVAPFALAGLYAVMSGVAPADGARPRRTLWLMMAGAALGIGTGLKLTLAPYGVGLAFAILSAGLPWRAALRSLVLYLGAAAAAFAIVAGPWMIFLWDAFGSPLFPQFNHILRSPYTAADPFRDGRWFPVTLWEWIAYPYFWAFERSNRIGEWPFADPRIALAFVALIAGAGALLLRARRSAHERDAASQASPNVALGWRLLVGFFLGGYVAWLLLFGYSRYLGPLELLAGLPIVGALMLIAGNGILAGGLSLAAAPAIVLMTHTPPWQRLPFQDRYFTMAIPPLAPRSLVLLADKPMAYVIPMMPRDARFVAVDNDIVQPGHDHRLARRVKDIVAAHDGPLYVLEFANKEARSNRALGLHRLERVAAECRHIVDGDVYGAKQLCPLRRLAAQ